MVKYIADEIISPPIKFDDTNQKLNLSPIKLDDPIKKKRKKVKRWSMNSCIIRSLKDKFNFNPKPNVLLKKRKRKENRCKSKNFLGLKLSIRRTIIKLFEEGKSVKEINKIYPELKKSSLYNMKANPIKYSLPENDIKQLFKEDIDTLRTKSSYKK